VPIQNSSESAEQAFESLFGKEKYGRVLCYGKTMTPSTFKKNEEIDVVKKEYENKMTHMTQEIQGLKAMVTFVVKQQNPDLDDEDLNNMMARILGKESSAIGPYSFASTHDPFNEQIYIIEYCLVDFQIYVAKKWCLFVFRY